jgi:tetratricopeptide (TPR) repeat protein
MSRAIFRALFLGLLFVSLNVSAQFNRENERFGSVSDGFDNMRSISGSVNSGSGTPIAGASVTIRYLRTGMIVFSGTTANDGLFEVSGISEGTFDVVVRHGKDEDRHTVRTDGPASFVRVVFRDSGADESGDSVALVDLRAPKKAQEALAKGRSAAVKLDLDNARKELEKALEIYPDYAGALTLLAVVTADPPKALMYAQRAAELAPESAFAHTVIASVLNRTGKFDPALKEADKAISLSPVAWQGHYERAQSLGAMGKMEEALASASRADELTRGQALQARVLLCRILSRLGREEEARTRLNAFIHSAPDQRTRDLAKAEMVNGFVKK